jgi:hypothetical protein
MNVEKLLSNTPENVRPSFLTVQDVYLLLIH